MNELERLGHDCMVATGMTEAEFIKRWPFSSYSRYLMGIRQQAAAQPSAEPDASPVAGAGNSSDAPARAG